MIYLKIIVLVFFTLCINASNHEHHSHVHGRVDLRLHVVENEIIVVLESSADTFLGFENHPSTQKEKDKVSSVFKFWKKEIFGLYKLNFDKGCHIKEAKIEQLFSSKNHSTIRAQALITCLKSLVGKRFSVDLSHLVSSDYDIHINLLDGRGKGHSKKDKASRKITLKL